MVLVTLAPYKFFVEQIAGDSVDVKLVVPTGASPHSYEPTARQILDASKADIWFLIGETFEERAVQALTSYNTDLKTVDMRDGIEMIEEREPGHEHCHHHGCEDPHIWMSPKLVKMQAETIADTLSEMYPERAELYSKNLAIFQEKLDDLDAEIVQILKSMKNRTILVSHPAYAYYCKDYGLKQISIEFEGKDPSPHQLTKILQRARENKSPFVYIQIQNPSKGAGSWRMRSERKSLTSTLMENIILKICSIFQKALLHNNLAIGLFSPQSAQSSQRECENLKSLQNILNCLIDFVFSILALI